MPTLTPKLGIKKPLGTDTVNRAALNENYDIVDAQVQKHIHQGTSAPNTPAEGDIWINTSTIPNRIARFTGGLWTAIGAASAADIGAVINAGQTPSFQTGMESARPAAGTLGRLYIATDTSIVYQDTGSAWRKVGVVNWSDIEGRPATFPAGIHGNAAHSPAMATATEFTTHANLTAAGTHGSAVAATINTLVHRDAAGRAQVAAPSVNADIARLDTVTAHTSLTNNPHAVTAPQIGAVRLSGDTMTGPLDTATATSQIESLGAVGTLRVLGSTTLPAAINFFRVGAFAVNFGLDLDNQLKIGGDSMGAVKHTLWHAGNDGSGSGLDADMVDGFSPAVAATANTLMRRDANGRAQVADGVAAGDIASFAQINNLRALIRMGAM